MRRESRSWRRTAGNWLGLALALTLAWAASAAAAEGTLDQVLKRGKLIVGIGLGAPPFGMYDAEKKPTGFDVDLAKPYVSWNLVLLGWKKDRNIKSYKDLKGKTVAVTRGTTQDIAITQLAPESKIVRYEDDPVAMLAFEQKKADVLPTAEVLALKKVKENKDMEIKGIVSRSWASIGVRHGDQDWLNWLNNFMDWNGGQGKFADLYEKWTGVKMPPALPNW